MSDLKKVLIITYYWPPASTAGVHRWLKFANALKKLGVEPILYVPENPSYPLTDPKLNEETEGLQVVRRKILEPYNLFKGFTGKEGVNTGFITEVKSKKSWKEELSIWVRGNLFIPDARKFWIKPSVRFLKRYLKENPVDMIISTGPPHSLHLIAARLKEQLGTPWMADFRDPWTTMDYYKKMKISAWADRIHRKLEGKVIREADLVTVVSSQMMREFEEMYRVKSTIFYGGYTEKGLAPDPSAWYERLNIVHAGTLLKDRNPIILWKALSSLKTEQPELYSFIRVTLVGRVDVTVKETIDAFGISDAVIYTGNVSHGESMNHQRNASVLLLSIDNIENSQFVVTSKVFEYIGAKRPILCIGNTTGDVADIVNQLENSLVIGFDDEQRMKEQLISYCTAVRDKKLDDVKGGEAFSIESRTRELIALLKAHV